MQIIGLGLKHTSAPLPLRARLKFSEDQIPASLAFLSCGNLPSPLAEMVILSINNITKIYSVSSSLSLNAMDAFFQKFAAWWHFSGTRWQVDEITPGWMKSPEPGR